MKKFLSFFSLFKYAFRGVVYCINNERNMRIHTVVAFAVFTFSCFCEFSKEHYAILAFTVAMVLTSEMLNTCVEVITDMIADRYDILARMVKDIAAGAVLISAIFAVFIAVKLLLKPVAFVSIYTFVSGKAYRMIIFIFVCVVSWFYIKYGPLAIINKIKTIFKR